MTVSSGSPAPAGPGRPFLSVHLKCCHVYLRIYPNAAGEAFVGWCPRCAAQVRVPIVAAGGSTGRLFSAG